MGDLEVFLTCLYGFPTDGGFPQLLLPRGELEVFHLVLSLIAVDLGSGVAVEGVGAAGVEVGVALPTLDGIAWKKKAKKGNII